MHRVCRPACSQSVGRWFADHRRSCTSMSNKSCIRWARKIMDFADRRRLIDSPHPLGANGSPARLITRTEGGIAPSRSSSLIADGTVFIRLTLDLFGIVVRARHSPPRRSSRRRSTERISRKTDRSKQIEVAARTADSSSWVKVAWTQDKNPTVFRVQWQLPWVSRGAGGVNHVSEIVCRHSNFRIGIAFSGDLLPIPVQAYPLHVPIKMGRSTIAIVHSPSNSSNDSS